MGFNLSRRRHTNLSLLCLVIFQSFSHKRVLHEIYGENWSKFDYIVMLRTWLAFFAKVTRSVCKVKVLKLQFSFQLCILAHSTCYSDFLLSSTGSGFFGCSSPLFLDVGARIILATGLHRIHDPKKRKIPKYVLDMTGIYFFDLSSGNGKKQCGRKNRW